MTTTQRKEWREKRGRTADTTPWLLDQASDVREYLVGWKEFPTTTGEPLPFTPENVDMVLDAIEYCEALWVGFLHLVNGTAKQKN